MIPAHDKQQSRNIAARTRQKLADRLERLGRRAVKPRSRVENDVDTVDQDNDGYDDYYSYASYGINVNDFLLQYKFALIPQKLSMGIGALIGLGGESFSIEQNWAGTYWWHSVY